MIYLSLPHCEEPHRLPFYLAMEEYAASIVGDEDMFFTWQVGPTVIFGRHQDMESEVNLAYCRQHGIEVYRRKSGGGCVFADMSNIMMSYITRSNDVQTTFKRYTGAIAGVLKGLGLDATDNSRNDILIGSKKVSGNAFYHKPGRSIVHGTMLYDTDMSHMTSALTPQRGKLAAKGVKSVSSRVTTLSQHLDMSLDEFRFHLHNQMCSRARILDSSEIIKIHEIEAGYLNPEFISGVRRKVSSIERSAHIDGVGSIRALIELKGNIIQSLSLSGDFLSLRAGAENLPLLCGVEFTPEAVGLALSRNKPEHWIMNLKARHFTELLFGGANVAERYAI